MFINGRVVPNITCPYCRFRHPYNLTCAEAAAIAEAAREAPEPTSPAGVAACEEIDASVFSGDLLWDVARRDSLKGYAERWLRAIAEQELEEIG